MNARILNAAAIGMVISAGTAIAQTSAQAEEQRVEYLSQRMKDDPCFGMPLDAAVGCRPPEPLTLTELQVLHALDLDTRDPTLHQKMVRRLETPVIRNFNPQVPAERIRKGILRAVQFNVARFHGFDAIRAFFGDCDQFIGSHTTLGGRSVRRGLREKLCRAVAADFYFLNEADAGVCRSDYRSAEELAMRLNLNLAQAMEWFEVRPTLVGLQDGEPGCRVGEVNPQLVRNEQYNVLLSRYPIRAARRVPLEACHDWFADERAPGGELRRGSRNALIAEVDLPGSDSGAMVVVVTHLENKSFLPTCRNRQLRQIHQALERMTEERGHDLPVVMGGDMNSVFGSEFFFMKSLFRTLGFETSDRFVGTYGFQTLDFILTRRTRELNCLRLRNEGIMREVAPGDVRSVVRTRLSDHAPLVADIAVRCGRR